MTNPACACGDLFGFVQLEEVTQFGTQFAMARDGLIDHLGQLWMAGRKALDGGVVQTGGLRSTAEFAQFAQLIDYTHGFLLKVDVLAVPMACAPTRL